MISIKDVLWERPERIRQRTHCINNHEFTDANTRIIKKPNNKYQRVCRTCDTEKKKRYDLKKRLAKVVVTSSGPVLMAEDTTTKFGAWRKTRHHLDTQKVVCLCAGGSVRSVTLAFVLKYQYRYDAIAASLERNSESLLKLLYEWADQIMVVQQGMEDSVPVQYLEKVLVVDIGPDQWRHSLHPDLVRRCQLLLEKVILT